mmetsp:Transcript_25609/g.74007  ORF Transcript_25609/g.74007 Transcript_25609/m.74007 type:complete len:667 (-) Transcript_25609:26-2026(-)
MQCLAAQLCAGEALPLARERAPVARADPGPPAEALGEHVERQRPRPVHPELGGQDAVLGFLRHVDIAEAPVHELVVLPDVDPVPDTQSQLVRGDSGAARGVAGGIDRGVPGGVDRGVAGGAAGDAAGGIVGGAAGDADLVKLHGNLSGVGEVAAHEVGLLGPHEAVEHVPAVQAVHLHRARLALRLRPPAAPAERGERRGVPQCGLAPEDHGAVWSVASVGLQPRRGRLLGQRPLPGLPALREQLAHREELVRAVAPEAMAAVLGNGGSVVVGRRDVARLPGERRHARQGRAAGPEAKVCATMSHVEREGGVPLQQHPDPGRELPAGGLDLGLVKGGSVPCLEPAGPQLHDELRALLVAMHLPEDVVERCVGVLPKARVDGREHVRQGTPGRSDVVRTVRGDEQHVGAESAARDGLQVLEVGPVHRLLGIPKVAVFILELHYSHGPAVLQQQRPEGRQQLAPEAVHELEVPLVGGAELHLLRPDVLEQPGREAAEVPLCADVGPRPQDHQQLLLLRQLDEPRQVPARRGEVEGALDLLVPVPGDVGAHGVEAQGPHPAEPVLPVNLRHAEVVDLAGVELHRLVLAVALQHEVAAADVEGGPQLCRPLAQPDRRAVGSQQAKDKEAAPARGVAWGQPGRPAGSCGPGHGGRGPGVRYGVDRVARGRP